MTIANLQTLGILKKARLSKDAVGGAVSTTDLKSGGLLVPEQGGRTARLDMQKRKLRKPVLLGKSCSEVAKEFNPDQPRDDKGRFAAAEKASEEAKTAGKKAEDLMDVRDAIKGDHAAYSKADDAVRAASREAYLTHDTAGLAHLEALNAASGMAQRPGTPEATHAIDMMSHHANEMERFALHASRSNEHARRLKRAKGFMTLWG